jgi:NhaP-type Na+/H+ or K+/H+ antiporter
MVATVGLIYLLQLFGHKKTVTLREIIFIGYAGMIRGAIAFGLVLRLEEYHGINEDSRQIITTTSLTLVVFTTIVFGSFMPLVQRLLVPGKEEPEAHEEIEQREAAFSV